MFLLSFTCAYSNARPVNLKELGILGETMKTKAREQSIALKTLKKEVDSWSKKNVMLQRRDNQYKVSEGVHSKLLMYVTRKRFFAFRARFACNARSHFNAHTCTGAA